MRSRVVRDPRLSNDASVSSKRHGTTSSHSPSWRLAAADARLGSSELAAGHRDLTLVILAATVQVAS